MQPITKVFKSKKIDNDGDLNQLKKRLTSKRDEISNILSQYFPNDIVGLLLKFLSYLDKICNTQDLDVQWVRDIQATFAMYESNNCINYASLVGSSFVEQDDYEERMEKMLKKQKQQEKSKQKQNEKKSSSNKPVAKNNGKKKRKYKIKSVLETVNSNNDDSKDNDSMTMQIHTNCIVNLGKKSNIGVTIYSFRAPKLDRRNVINCEALIFFYSIFDFFGVNNFINNINRGYNYRYGRNFNSGFVTGIDWIANGRQYGRSVIDESIVKFRQRPLYLFLTWKDEQEKQDYIESINEKGLQPKRYENTDDKSTKHKENNKNKNKNNIFKEKSLITISDARNRVERDFCSYGWDKKSIKHLSVIMNDIASIDEAMLVVLSDKLKRAKFLMNGST